MATTARPTAVPAVTTPPADAAGARAPWTVPSASAVQPGEDHGSEDATDVVGELEPVNRAARRAHQRHQVQAKHTRAHR